MALIYNKWQVFMALAWQVLDGPFYSKVAGFRGPRHLTPDIAIKTNHSKEAVDRYIKDYHRVELLWQHDIKDLDKISQLARLSKKVVQQYIDLLPSKLKNSISKNINSQPVLELNNNFP